MFNFCDIAVTQRKAGEYVIEPKFKTAIQDSDIMVKGGDFLAVYDEETKMWVTNDDFIIHKVDEAIWAKHAELTAKSENKYIPMIMGVSDTGAIDRYLKYVQKQQRDNFKPLDTTLTFLNTDVKRTDYATKRLPYSLEQGETPAYDELMNVLYSEAERAKIEWACGSIIAGDAKRIQKFIVLYGSAGTGKGTVLDIIGLLFEGYTAPFSAQDLTSNNAFPLEAFKDQPLVGIDPDGKMDRIENNTLLNSLVSHEKVVVNAKYSKKYSAKFDTFLFVGTNSPVKITEAKSGLLRRLIDVSPTGNKVPNRRYNQLMSQIKTELGAIAYKMLQKYEEMGINYYDTYVPMSMLVATNDFYDFVEYYYEEFIDQPYVQLQTAWNLYSTYCDMAKVPHPMPYRAFKAELGNYFESFEADIHDEKGAHIRSAYVGFKKDKFNRHFTPIDKTEEIEDTWLKFDTNVSSLDIVLQDCPAQLAVGEKGIPKIKWVLCNKKLGDIPTDMLHYVKPPENHIVIDFDLKDKEGNKNRKLNIEAASKFPPTYAELSKSGEGIHLHYIYNGDVSKLSSVYGEHIEVKVFTGGASLRRKRTLCNSLSIATISSGLPLRKKEKKVVDFKEFKNEAILKSMIKRALNKEYHPNTTPNVHFIKELLDRAYAQKDFVYDVEGLYQSILYFASCSSNNSDACLELVKQMRFKSELQPEEGKERKFTEEQPIVFYDVEVFPNLFLVNWKFRGKEHKCNRMINPTPGEVVKLFKYRLIGFNNRRYDNHIMYARAQGFSNSELFGLSKRLINDDKNVTNKATFANAYGLSYTDVYDFCSKKQSLKKWEIELGIHHKELGLPWDKPVPEDRWEEVAEYCDNDVYATEAVFEANQADWIARQIIAKLSGLTVNASGNAHSAAIIFDGCKDPQGEFVYTDLSTIFDGYVFEDGKSYYRGELIGEGGYVYAEPGMYENVWTFDVASMHPHSAIALNIFGDRYTKRFKDLVDLRIHIKHKEFDIVREMFDGVLAEFVGDDSMVKQLAYALKIVINSVYGLTSAKFANAFKDPRNIDNIVAKRGALFMCLLKNNIQEMGIQVIHVKTDSIKISNPTPELAEYIINFGKEYGYDFEVEDVYEKLCLVNDAVYIAREESEPMKLNDCVYPGKDGWSAETWATNGWTATGAQFKQPYVFKTMFSQEDLVFDDFCESKQVKTAMHLDFNPDYPDGEPDLHFVGKVGLFTPVTEAVRGGTLLVERASANSGTGVKYDAVAGTKGYKWVESESLRDYDMVDLFEKVVDVSYYTTLVDKARDTLAKFGDVDIFIND